MICETCNGRCIIDACQTGDGEGGTCPTCKGRGYVRSPVATIRRFSVNNAVVQGVTSVNLASAAASHLTNKGVPFTRIDDSLLICEDTPGPSMAGMLARCNFSKLEEALAAMGPPKPLLSELRMTRITFQQFKHVLMGLGPVKVDTAPEAPRFSDIKITIDESVPEGKIKKLDQHGNEMV